LRVSRRRKLLSTNSAIKIEKLKSYIFVYHNNRLMIGGSTIWEN